MNEPLPAGYPIRAVSKLTGIGIDALRVWERRYKSVVPARTPRGRLYSAVQVQRLMLLRDATLAGHSIGQVSKLEDGQIRELLATPPATTAGPAIAAEHTVIRPVLAAIENYEYTTANNELGVLASLLPIPELVYRVVHPLLDLVGKRWYGGTLTVAQEHMISALLRNLLGGLVRLYHPREPRVRLLFATPAGEMHEFGILCGAMLAVAAGVEAVYLGPNLPTPEIVGITNRLKPEGLVLGVVAPGYVPDLGGALHFIAEQIPAKTAFWVGGSGVRPAIDGETPQRTLFLESFESMSPHLTRLLEAH
ncbi:MAG: transcriptional regulator, MerR family [Candidatus Solibacter sp.]|nr:transcriptional regulator, MerR family [Candidatus Solibacter sp.]